VEPRSLYRIETEVRDLRDERRRSKYPPGWFR